MWDTPAAASAWLKTFAINNEELLKETDVNIHSELFPMRNNSSPIGFLVPYKIYL